MKNLFLLLIAIVDCHISYANQRFYDYTKDHKEAYELIISLRFEEGKRIIERIKEKNPDDLLVYHIENYIDFLSIFINENKAEFELKQKNKELRLEKLRSGNPEDPYYLFSQAEIHLQWALVRLKFEEYLTAALEVNKAIGMLEKNEKKFPDYISNKKSLSLLHAIAGTIPEGYRSFIGVISNFDGSIHQGVEEIEEVVMFASKNDYFFEKEAIAIKVLILLNFKNDKKAAWNFLNKARLDTQNNPLATFLYASTAMKCGKNDAAIGVLEKRERSLKFFPMYYLDYMLGSAKLYRQDINADVYLKSYVANFSGQNYIKESYRKLAWYELTVNRNLEKYADYMSLCMKNGSTNIEEDKSANREAKSKEEPHPSLLKARLLYDGGYGELAKEIMDKVHNENLSQDQKIEYYYRNGRILHQLSLLPEAINSYKKCIEIGASSPAYFACNASLQLGLIKEESGDLEQSANCFNQCLSMKPSEYRNSIHQKAKAGLNRINTK